MSGSDVQAALREQLALLIDAVTEYAIFLLDREGRVMSWNAGAQHSKGYTAEEIIGRHFSVFYTEADRARDHPASELRIAARDGRYEEEGWRVRKDGSQFWANVVITALKDRERRVIGFGKVTRDLTERRETEQRLLAANAELDRFTTLAAHDLQEPLRTVSGFARLLLDRHADALPEDGRRFLRQIFESSDRMSSLVAELLAYARAGRPSVDSEPVRVRDVAEEVLRDLALIISDRSATVELTVGHDAVVGATRVDVALLLQNLIANALRFGRHIRVADERDGLGWRLTVSDDGPGIAPDEQTRIFEPFERGGDRGGTGLGLSICRRIAARHGGAVGVQSAPGRGSTFWVRLCEP